MAFQIAVADSVFPNLDPARAVVSRIGGQLQLAANRGQDLACGIEGRKD